MVGHRLSVSLMVLSMGICRHLFPCRRKLVRRDIVLPQLLLSACDFRLPWPCCSLDVLVWTSLTEDVMRTCVRSIKFIHIRESNYLKKEADKVDVQLLRWCVFCNESWVHDALVEFSAEFDLQAVGKGEDDAFRWCSRLEFSTAAYVQYVVELMRDSIYDHKMKFF